MKTLKATFTGCADEKHPGFTVGKQYDIEDHGDGYISTYDDDGCYRAVENGAFYKFELLDGDQSFETETDCAGAASYGDKKPRLRYYINEHEVDMIEFGNVRYTVDQLDEDGVKCDTIKFEVKFQ
ncbi:JK_35P [Escherichia phage Jk06]|uniref:JK_35P n=1 Tax=Escherichia phage Jk06 TaxID=2886922 RepID=Q45PY1_9CAUD|nr:virion structural protein [Escherichia phage Jk06]AAZ29285.1 JK_35P [Escherichia phage Jk06]